MTELLDPAPDPVLVDLLKGGDNEAAQLDRALTPSEFHRSGLELLAQGYAAQAEFCFRAARQGAFAKNQPTLGMMATLDLSLSLNERNPRCALGALSQLSPARLDRNLLSVFYMAIGHAVVSLCKFSTADRCYRNSLAAASERNDLVRMAFAMGNLATILFEQGMHTEARRMNNEALEILIDSKEEGNFGLLLTNLAVHAMYMGQYDEANDHFEKQAKLAATTGNVRVYAYGLVNRGELEFLLGNLESAHTLFRQSEKYASMASLPVIQAQALISRAMLEENLGADALLESTAACARDLCARDLGRQAGPLAILIASFAAARGQSAEPYLSILDSSYAGLQFTRQLMDHYRRMIRILETKHRPRTVQPFPRFLTQNETMISIQHKLGRLVSSDVRILIEGETGTGKSFLARQVHAAGEKSSSPFIIVDCTNLEENLFESKLFGHLRGSFTGAISDTVGLVEQANGGTLFLDEIGELPTEIQGKLLYTIEEQRYRPVGAKQERHSEFRLIAATNRNIDEMLAAGALRKDLFFRIAGFRVTLPPLRDRREDIIPLAELKLEQLNRKYRKRKSLRSHTWEALVQYAWPGNVRELNTALERGYHLSVRRRISLDDLGLGLSPDTRTAEDLSWYTVRREHLLRVLKLCRGNVAKAAQMLGLNRTTLIYKLKLLDIERKDFAPAQKVPEQAVTRAPGDPEGREAATRASRTRAPLEGRSGESATA